jgi:hypothetical protein
MICTPHQILFEGDRIKEDEMGGECGALGRKDKHIRLWWGNLKARGDLKDLDLNLILKRI